MQSQEVDLPVPLSFLLEPKDQECKTTCFIFGFKLDSLLLLLLNLLKIFICNDNLFSVRSVVHISFCIEMVCFKKKILFHKFYLVINAAEAQK